MVAEVTFGGANLKPKAKDRVKKEVLETAKPWVESTLGRGMGRGYLSQVHFPEPPVTTTGAEHCGQQELLSPQLGMQRAEL